MNRIWLPALVSMMIFFLLAGCGGGGGSSSPDPSYDLQVKLEGLQSDNSINIDLLYDNLSFPFEMIKSSTESFGRLYWGREFEISITAQPVGQICLFEESASWNLKRDMPDRDLTVSLICRYHSRLNDTGSLLPADNESGRDFYKENGQLTKRGNGDAGFDFEILTPNIQACGVKDHHTGLVWLAKSDIDGLFDENHEFVKSGDPQPEACKSNNKPVVDGCSVDKYIIAVNEKEYCSLTNWRLPTRRELLSLWHFGKESGVAVDDDRIPGILEKQYWAEEAVQSSEAESWTVNFSVLNVPKVDSTPHPVVVPSLDSSSLPVILVSGKWINDQRSDRFLDNEDGTITDHETGLMWKKCPEGTFYDGKDLHCSPHFPNLFLWNGALDRVSVINSGVEGEGLGHDDWRLPNIKELESWLVMKELLNDSYNTFYWSSTSEAGNQDFAWVVNFSSANLGSFVKTAPNNVRLVRGGHYYQQSSQ